MLAKRANERNNDRLFTNAQKWEKNRRQGKMQGNARSDTARALLRLWIFLGFGYPRDQAIKSTGAVLFRINGGL
jgi:hypothetical protein